MDVSVYASVIVQERRGREGGRRGVMGGREELVRGGKRESK